MSAAVADDGERALREPPEESDGSLCRMFPWMSEESLCDVWRERLTRRVAPHDRRDHAFFTYDRRYDNGSCPDTLLLRLGGEAALVAWARTLAEVDDWLLGDRARVGVIAQARSDVAIAAWVTDSARHSRTTPPPAALPEPQGRREQRCQREGTSDGARLAARQLQPAGSPDSPPEVPPDDAWAADVELGGPSTRGRTRRGRSSGAGAGADATAAAGADAADAAVATAARASPSHPRRRPRPRRARTARSSC